MRRDIDEALRDWPFEPESGELAVREVPAKDGRSVIQIRIELGILQLEEEGRPDGYKPQGFATYLEYLKNRARSSKRKNDEFQMNREMCEQADREFTQFYHRRIAWLALNRYDKAIRDADHTLGLMDFVREHGPSPEYIATHEHFRGLVLFHRTQAAVALSLERHKPEDSIEAIREGIDRLRRHQKTLAELPSPEDGIDEEASCQTLVEQLQRLEQEIRRQFEVPKSLRELLDEAIEREDYEAAAKIRDQMKEDPAGE